MKKAGNIARKNLLSMGTCFGKFTKTDKFRLQITALDFLAPYAKVLDILLYYPQLLNLALFVLKIKREEGMFWL